MMITHVQTVAKIAESIVYEAGHILRDHYNHPIRETVKGHKFDIVTQTDKACEDLIVDALKKAFPGHYIIGEEGGGNGISIDEAPFRWYIDPVDGTINFANHIPMFAVTIAMTNRNMQPLVGIIYNPLRVQMYSAVRGHGAFLNGQPIQVSQKARLDAALAGSDFAPDRGDRTKNNFPEWRTIVPFVYGVRCLGSAALDLALVAEGKLDIYWQGQLKPWDLLAGVLLIEEAGGVVTDFSGNTAPEKIADGQILATNGFLHETMLKMMRQIS